MTATLEELVNARNVLKAWADEVIIADICIPKEDRAPGCLSCDTLRFFECLDSEIEEMKKNGTA